MFERDRLSMFDIVEGVEAFADNLLVVGGDHATDERPRTNKSSSLRGALERTLHHASIEIDGLESGVWGQSDVIVPRRRELCQAEEVRLAAFTRRFTFGLTKLRVRNAEQLRKSLGRLRCQLPIGAQVRFDYLRRRFVRIIDDGVRIVRGTMAVMHDAFNGHVEPRGQPGDVVGVGFAGAVFNPRQRRSRYARFISDIAQAQSVLFPAASHRTAQFGRVDSGLISHARSLTRSGF
jgi:hypothetical protein